MTKKLLLLLVAAALTMPAWAEEQGRAHKEESVGVGGGAAVGAIAGGPIGVIVGAALGGWLGDRFHREREKVVSSEQRYRDAQARMESLQGRLQGSKSELDELQAEWRLVQGNYRDALQVALESQVFFRTAQSALDDSAVQRLARIAELVQPMEQLVIVVEGHADARGDADYNEQLSAERAAVVRDSLIRAGVLPDRITVSAEGERQSKASESDLDALAMERRVNLSIVDQQLRNRVAQH